MFGQLVLHKKTKQICAASSTFASLGHPGICAMWPPPPAYALCSLHFVGLKNMPFVVYTLWLQENPLLPVHSARYQPGKNNGAHVLPFYRVKNPIIANSKGSKHVKNLPVHKSIDHISFYLHDPCFDR